VDSTPVIRSTDGPVTAEDELSERVREWCDALGIPFTDLSELGMEETPKK
jgi:hypothetical protein